MASADTTHLLESLASAGGEAELFTASSDSLEVSFAAGKVKGAMAREVSGLGVRALREGKLGFVGCRDLSPEGLSRLEGNVAGSLAVGDPSQLEFPGPSQPERPGDELELSDEATAALETGDLLAAGQEVLGALEAEFPHTVFDLTVRRSIGKVGLSNTRGHAHEDGYTVFSLSVEANKTEDEDVFMDWSSVSSTSRERARPERVVEQLRQRLSWGREIVDFKPGRYPVLFTPSGSLLLWSPLLQALSGKTVMLGTSPLREKVGQQVVSPRIQLIDDGLLTGALGSSAFDDEGIPRQTRTLIEDGVLRGFVHDLETAQACGHEPTGNGERGGATARPEPGFSNVLIRGGEQSWRELLGSIDYGVLCHRVMGMGQGNTLPGTFSNPLDLAFLIEGGEVKGRIKDASIAGNIYELLADDRLGGLSSEVEPVGGSAFLPWLRIEGVNLVGKNQAG